MWALAWPFVIVFVMFAACIGIIWKGFDKLCKPIREYLYTKIIESFTNRGMSELGAKALLSVIVLVVISIFVILTVYSVI